jgi:hypothetical protein
MSYKRPLFLRIALILWAVYIIAAPPGLPVCWLERVPCEFHTHFGPHDEAVPHTHFYLLELTLGMASQPYPFVFLTSSILVLLLSMSGVKIRRTGRPAALQPGGWEAVPEPPPPKFMPA